MIGTDVGKTGTYNDMSACASQQSQIADFREIVEEILQNPNPEGGNTQSEVHVNLFHLARSHLWDPSLALTQHLLVLSEDSFARIHTKTTVFMVTSLRLNLLIMVSYFNSRSRIT
jgi:hypothetical protein